MFRAKLTGPLSGFTLLPVCCVEGGCASCLRFVVGRQVPKAFKEVAQGGNWQSTTLQAGDMVIVNVKTVRVCAYR